MKKTIKTIAAAIALSAVVAGPASAMVVQNDLLKDIRGAAAADTNVSAFVKGDTVTITGYYADANDQNRVNQAALAHEGVNKVIDLAFTSN